MRCFGYLIPFARIIHSLVYFLISAIRERSARSISSSRKIWIRFIELGGTTRRRRKGWWCWMNRLDKNIARFMWLFVPPCFPSPPCPPQIYHAKSKMPLISHKSIEPTFPGKLPIRIPLPKPKLNATPAPLTCKWKLRIKLKMFFQTIIKKIA